MDKKSIYILMSGAAMLGYWFGDKHGKEKASKAICDSFVKNWKQIYINGKPMHLYFNIKHQDEIQKFVDVITSNAKELSEIKKLTEEVTK